MAVAIHRNSSAPAIAAAGIAFTALFVAGVVFLMNTATYREWGGPLVALAIILVSVPILAQLARREDEPLVFWLFLGALLLKLIAAPIRHYLTLEVYGVADAVVYHRVGNDLADLFRAGTFEIGGVLESFTDTEFIKLLTGVVYTFIGPTSWGGFLFFSWMSFWGSFLMYRAFVTSVPHASAKFYFCGLFFLPSMLYWPASIGKEAWMILALGIAVYGSARILRGRLFSGVPIALLGLWLSGIVRPHIAGFVGVALAMAFVARPAGKHLRELAPLAKGISVALVAGIALFVALQAAAFLQSSGIDTEAGLTTALSGVSERTDEGDSTFTPPSLASPAGLPAALVTVLYRPFVFEAHNAQALVTAAEGTVVALLTVLRFPSIIRALRNLRSHPYVTFSLIYVACAIVGFSSFANFGLLARQRTLLLPMFLVLLSLGPTQQRPGERAGAGARGSSA